MNTSNQMKRGYVSKVVNTITGNGVGWKYTDKMKKGARKYKFVMSPQTTKKLNNIQQKLKDDGFDCTVENYDAYSYRGSYNKLVVTVEAKHYPLVVPKTK